MSKTKIKTKKTTKKVSLSAAKGNNIVKPPKKLSPKKESKRKVKDIAKVVTSFESACKVLGLDSKKLPDVSMLPLKYQKYIISSYKLITITEALNQGWVANYKDWNQYKYFPYFYYANIGAGAFVSSGTYCEWTSTVTIGGSRLAFKTRELAGYAGQKFTELYKDVYTMEG